MDSNDISILIGRLERESDVNPRLHLIKVAGVSALGYAPIAVLGLGVLVGLVILLASLLKGAGVSVLGIVLVLFAVENWSPVTIQLWGGLAADLKKPVLVLIAFLLGFLPTLLIYRARLWALRRRLETSERNAVMAQMAASAAEPISPEEQAAIQGADQRVKGYGGGTS